MLVNAEASNAQMHMQQGNNDDFAASVSTVTFAPKPGDERSVDIAYSPRQSKSLAIRLTAY